MQLTLEAVRNYQNDGGLRSSAGKIPEDIWTHFKQQNTIRVLASTAVASSGWKSLLVFIEESVKVNSRVYQ